MPDGSGIELINTLYSHQPLFGIALTGYGMEDDIQKSYDSGFNHHLVKPVDLNKLDLLIQQGVTAPGTHGFSGCCQVGPALLPLASTSSRSFGNVNL